MAYDPNPGRADRRRLTHVDRRGRPRMVDVGDKPVTARRAVAEAMVLVEQETLSMVIDGAGPKGDVLTVAELAGVMAAKRTSELIPLCHPLPLTDIGVEITPDRVNSALRVRTTVATTSQTGVEMEALTAAAVAALTVYDMVKGVDRSAEIRHIRLLEKSRRRQVRGVASAAGPPDGRHAPRPTAEGRPRPESRWLTAATSGREGAMAIGRSC